MAKITELTPDSRNANKGTERGAGMLEKSLRKHGAGRSILIDKNGKVIAGNKTLESAAGIGIEDVIVVESDGTRLVAVKRTDIDLDTPQGRELAIADNRTGEVSLEWDADELAALSTEIDLSDLFSDTELAELIGGLDEPKAAPDAQIDKAEELQAKWQTASGQLWQVGAHRLLCGDSTKADDVARVMGGDKAGCVLTDPPYGMNLDTDYTKLPKTPIESTHYDSVIGDDVDFEPMATINMFPECPEVFMWGADYFYSGLPKGGSWIVWDKRNESSDGLVGNHFEVLWSSNPHRRRMIRHLWAGFTARNQDQNRTHPTEKPVPVLVDIIQTHLKADAVIVDPFLGSGTTMVAAEQLGRVCYGIEIEPKYCAVVLERMAAMGLTPELAD